MSTKKNQKYSITLFENTLVCFMRLYKEIRRQKAEDYIPCLECDSLEKEFEEMQNDNDLSLFLRTLRTNDTETYSDEETNSCNRYTSYENWVEGFYEPFIEKTISLISDDASFILNVGERKYPLAKSMYEICKKHEIFANEIDSYLVGRGEGREKFYHLSKKKKQLTIQTDLF